VLAHPEGVDLGTLVDAEPGGPWSPIPPVLQVVSMLLHMGYVLPQQTEVDCAPARACNRVLAAAACAKAPYRHFSLPRAGTAALVSETEWVVLDAALSGVDRSGWAGHISRSLPRLGRSLVHEGKPVTEESSRLQLLEQLIAGMAGKLEFFRRMGAI
jgi:hypothetical protein